MNDRYTDKLLKEGREEKIKKKIKKKSATKDFGKAKKSLNRHLVERYYRGQGSGRREKKDSHY